LSTKEIYLKDERFRISYYFSLEKMIDSLKKIGLIHPPLVTYRQGRAILVSGWKRVLACLKLSLASIPVEVSQVEDDLQNFFMAFYENLATRNFSLVEKAEIIHKLKEFGLEKNHIIKDYLPLLDIPSSSFCYEGYLALAQFKPEEKELIHEKNILFSSLQKLSAFKPESRKLILPFLLSLGQNKQKEVLENLQEISQRENIPVEEFLMTEEIQDILSSEKLPPLQKADNFRLLLRKRRYPLLSFWRESFDSSLKKMRWPKEIGIKHSPFFEDENISVTFNFKNKEELEENLMKLQKMASHEEFPRIFK